MEYIGILLDMPERQLQVDNETEDCAGNVIDISYVELVYSLVPIVVVTVIAYFLRLKMTSLYVIGAIRTFVQLTAVGYILLPIFDAGEEFWWVVVLYVFLMIILASYESSVRPRYSFKGSYFLILAAITVSLTLISVYAFGVIIRPTPVWDPRYTIAICGMMLGNNVSAVSLALNSLLNNLMDRREEVELLTGFGASKYEASLPFVREAVRVGLTPTLNQMVVIGIISLPGMMTGQILGGTPPIDATRYQIMIMYLLASCSFMVVLLVVISTVSKGFDKSHIFRYERFKKKSFMSKDILMITGYSIYSHIKHLVTKTATKKSISSDSKKGDLGPVNKFTLVPLHQPITQEESLKVKNVARVVIDHATGMKRTLFEDFSATLNRGDIALIKGPSGSGKTQFLRLVAGLDPLLKGKLFLNDKERSEFQSMMQWRKRVRYVFQSRVAIPGTPMEFMKRVVKLEVNKRTLNLEDMVKEVEEILEILYVDKSRITQEWKELSGGEAQRMLVAISFATRPDCLLLDEPDSALDLKAKMSFEEYVKKIVKERLVTAVWITHDEEQYSRLMGV